MVALLYKIKQTFQNMNSFSAFFLKLSLGFMQLVAISCLILCICSHRLHSIYIISNIFLWAEALFMQISIICLILDAVIKFFVDN